MGPTRVLSAPGGPPCWPHEPCSQGHDALTGTTIPAAYHYHHIPVFEHAWFHLHHVICLYHHFTVYDYCSWNMLYVLFTLLVLPESTKWACSISSHCKLKSGNSIFNRVFKSVAVTIKLWWRDSAVVPIMATRTTWPITCTASPCIRIMGFTNILLHDINNIILYLCLFYHLTLVKTMYWYTSELFNTSEYIFFIIDIGYHFRFCFVCVLSRYIRYILDISRSCLFTSSSIWVITELGVF